MRKNVLTAAKKKKAHALLNAGNLTEARDLLAKVCRLDKLDVEARRLLGGVYGKLEMHQMAAECFSQIISYQPSVANAHFNLGIALRALGQFEGAVTAFRNTVELDSSFPDAQNCLAHAFMLNRNYEEAIEAFQQVLAHSTVSADTYSNLGSVYQQLGRLEEALACYRKAQEINPAIAYENMGSALAAQAKFAEAIACYREGVSRDPRNCLAYSNLLLTMNYAPHLQAEEIFQAHVGWGKTCGYARKKGEFPNVRNLERKLRVGYVSPDFREHSVAYFIQPLLAAHHPDEVEVYCYSRLAVEHHDGVTARIRNLAHAWRDIAALSTEQVAERVQADGIDILVDLSGHTASHSLEVFALQPAPLQVTYLGYPNTTGMEAIDYRITDNVADPHGVEKYYAEELIRLPGCFLCYQPPHVCPAVSPLPCLDWDGVTFGSFNNLAKMNEEVLAVWAKLLCKLPDAKLFLKNHSLADRYTRDRLLGFFEEHGVVADRVEMQGATASTYKHLELYGKVDIALDTFPYNGTTTTCEALWMGVPVITLLGEAHAGRVGGSLLTTVGKAEWVAHSEQQYIQYAADLAGDWVRLGKIRKTLREVLSGSALLEHEPFARKIESAYRKMWQEWCNRST